MYINLKEMERLAKILDASSVSFSEWMEHSKWKANMKRKPIERDNLNQAGVAPDARRKLLEWAAKKDRED